MLENSNQTSKELSSQYKLTWLLSIITNLHLKLSTFLCSISMITLQLKTTVMLLTSDKACNNLTRKHNNKHYDKDDYSSWLIDEHGIYRVTLLV